MRESPVAVAGINARRLGDKDVGTVRLRLQHAHQILVEGGQRLRPGQNAIFRDEAREEVGGAHRLHHAHHADLDVGQFRGHGRGLLAGGEKGNEGHYRETERTPCQSAHQSRLPLVLRTTLPVRETA